jgi:hypothetical protein
VVRHRLRAERCDGLDRYGELERFGVGFDRFEFRVVVNKAIDAQLRQHQILFVNLLTPEYGVRLL